MGDAHTVTLLLTAGLMGRVGPPGSQDPLCSSSCCCRDVGLDPFPLLAPGTTSLDVHCVAGKQSTGKEAKGIII